MADDTKTAGKPTAQSAGTGAPGVAPTPAPAPAPAAAPAAAQTAAGKLAEAQERLELLKILRALELENRMMRAKLESNTPEQVEELKKENKELLEARNKLETDVLAEMLARKKTFDATSVSDKLQILKAAVISYCKDRNVDPSLWKNLESL